MAHTSVLVLFFPVAFRRERQRKEALTNIKDGIDGYIASLKKRNEPIPPPIEEETVEVRA